MKTIGLIGGMSWESTVTYYQIVNRLVQERLGGFHSAKCILHSVDFHEIEACQRAGDWERSGELLAEAARGLERAGADCVLICTNTMHRVAPQVQENINIPILHIAQATARRLKQRNIKRAALLGTIYTMEQDFYKQRLSERHAIDVAVPNEMEREVVHRVIYQELCLGQIQPESRAAYRRIMQRLVEQEAAQAIILGCTEISLLVDQSDASVPLFDTTAIHAQAAAEFALS